MKFYLVRSTGFTRVGVVMCVYAMRCRAVAVTLAFGLMLGPTVGLLFGHEPGFRVMITKKGLDYGKRM